MKLFLFDIDGTLISPGPAARKAINKAIENFTGLPPNLQIEDVAGLTDRLIVKNALIKAGQEKDITAAMDGIIDNYLEIFEQTYHQSDGAFVYEDSIDLVNKVKAQNHPIGLLTGNVKRGANSKLRKFGLMEHFPFGAFGDDGNTREDLPVFAQKEAKKVLGKSFDFRDIVLVGDTPEDAKAAAVNGCRSIVVCRRKERYDDIVKAGAELIVDSLTDPIIEERFLNNLS